MITKVHRGKDERIRFADIKYRNNSENVNRITHRAVRKLIMIHPVEELKELHEIATAADIAHSIELEKD